MSKHYSKANNKKNNKNLKISSSMRKTAFVIAIIILVLGTGNIFKAFEKEEIEKQNQEIYKYTDSFSSNYKVNLSKNDYITDADIPNNKQYVSDLISDVNLNLKYNYDSTQESEVTYDYKIDVIVKGSYTKDKEVLELINKVVNLKTENQKKANSKDVKIDENVIVDYKQYHDLIKNFKQNLGMSIDSKLYVVLTVNTQTEINGQIINNQYISNFNISLGEKVALVDGKLNDTKSGTSSKQSENETQTVVVVPRLVFGIILIAISVIIAYFTVNKTKIFHSVDNRFKKELSNLLKRCQDRVAMVEDDAIDGITNTIKVFDIDELIKLSDELFTPILCIVSEEEEKAIFYILKDNIKYIYQYPSYKFADDGNDYLKI